MNNYEAIVEGKPTSPPNPWDSVDSHMVLFTHKEWLKHPLTKQFLQWIVDEKNSIAQSIADKSDSTILSSDMVRWDGIKLKQLHKIEKYVYEGIAKPDGGK